MQPAASSFSILQELSKGSARICANNASPRPLVDRRCVTRCYGVAVARQSIIGPPDAARRVHGAPAEAGVLDLRLRLADVVALLLLRSEGPRPRARLSPRAVHPLDALSRHAAPPGAGDGPVPRRLVLGHGLSHRSQPPAPRAGAPVGAGDDAPRLPSAAGRGAAAQRPHGP